MKKVLWKLWRIYAHLVGIIFIVVSLYLVIKFSIVYQPVNVDSDMVTKVEIICIDIAEEKRYIIGITDQKTLNELVNKTNSLKVTKERKCDEYDYSIYINLNDIEYSYDICIRGNQLILGEDAYTMKKKDKKNYIEYIKHLIEESDNCIVEEW